jgi:hypothetical protein
MESIKTAIAKQFGRLKRTAQPASPNEQAAAPAAVSLSHAAQYGSAGSAVLGKKTQPLCLDCQ